jgi:hypothetical protein
VPTTTVVARRRPYGFLHLAVSFTNASGAPENTEIEAVLNKAKDWIRYLPNCWLIYTSRSPESWFKDLEGVPKMDKHSFFICEINPKNRAGRMYPGVWQWADKSRDNTGEAER